MVSVTIVTRFQNDIDFMAERFQKIEKNIEQNFAACSRHNDGDFDSRFFVVVKVVPVASLRNDLQVVRWPNGISQSELTVSCDFQMRFELIFAEILETASALFRLAVAIRVLEKSLQEPHDSPLSA
jgi:hypothetical protein